VEQLAKKLVLACFCALGACSVYAMEQKNSGNGHGGEEYGDDYTLFTFGDNESQAQEAPSEENGAASLRNNRRYRGSSRRRRRQDVRGQATSGVFEEVEHDDLPLPPATSPYPGVEFNLHETCPRVMIFSCCVSNDMKSLKELVPILRDELNGLFSLGRTLLTFICEMSGDEPAEVAQLLILYGADVNVHDRLGNFPLGNACMANNAAVVRVLCAQPELEVNRRIDSWSPLQIACWHDRVDVVRELLRHPDIDIHKTPKAFCTPPSTGRGVVFRRRRGSSDVQPHFFVGEISEGKWYTPLCIAVRKGGNELVRELIVRPEMRVGCGRFDVHRGLLCACEEGDADLVKVFLRYVPYPAMKCLRSAVCICQIAVFMGEMDRKKTDPREVGKWVRRFHVRRFYNNKFPKEKKERVALNKRCSVFSRVFKRYLVRFWSAQTIDVDAYRRVIPLLMERVRKVTEFLNDSRERILYSAGQGYFTDGDLPDVTRIGWLGGGVTVLKSFVWGEFKRARKRTLKRRKRPLVRQQREDRIELLRTRDPALDAVGAVAIMLPSKDTCTENCIVIFKSFLS